MDDNTAKQYPCKLHPSMQLPNCSNSQKVLYKTGILYIILKTSRGSHVECMVRLSMVGLSMVGLSMDVNIY